MAVPLESLVPDKYYFIAPITNADPEAMDLGEAPAPYYGKFERSTETTAVFTDITDRRGNSVTVQSEFSPTEYDFVDPDSTGGRRRRRKTRSRKSKRSRRRSRRVR